MRKGIFACLLALLLPMHAALAEAVWHITDVRMQAEEGWHEKYESYGREITVDLPVNVPDVPLAPILRVIFPQTASEPAFMAKAKSGAKMYTGFESRLNDHVTWLSYQLPFVLDEANGERMGTVTWPQSARAAYDWDKPYADNNPLTVREAYMIALEKAKAIFPDMEFSHTQFIGLEGRYYSKLSGEPLREMGGYRFRLRQILHGIPLLTAVNRVFTRPYMTKEYYDYDFFIDARIVAEDAFHLYCAPIAEDAVVYEDVPLIGFDEIKAEYERLIMAGHIRQIYSLNLGYVLYDNPGAPGDSFILAPTWVARCEYYADRRDEATSFDLDALYFEAGNYRAVLVNTQTGRAVDAEDDSELRGFCPAILTFEDGKR